MTDTDAQNEIDREFWREVMTEWSMIRFGARPPEPKLTSWLDMLFSKTAEGRREYLLGLVTNNRVLITAINAVNRRSASN